MGQNSYKPRPFPQPLPGVQNNNGPSLDLSFLSALDPRLAFARTTTGTYIDVNGTRQTAAINAPRFDYNPVTHTARGMYVEGAETQFLLHSDAPVTQTITLSILSAYTLWVEGTGSCVVTAGTGTATGLGTATAGSPVVFTMTGAGTMVFTVTGTVTVFQVERVGFATSFIVSAGTTGSRTVDVCNHTLNNTWFKVGPGTFVVEVMWEANVVGTFFSISDGTTSNQMFMQRNATFNVQGKMANAGTVVQASGSIPALNTVAKVGVSFNATTTVLAVNGTISQTISATSSAASWTLVNFGSGIAAGAPMFGWMRRVRYWPRTLSTGEMQKVTT